MTSPPVAAAPPPLCIGVNGEIAAEAVRRLCAATYYRIYIYYILYPFFKVHSEILETLLVRSVPEVWYSRERARINSAMLTGQSTGQKPTAKSLPQAARGSFLASPSRTCRSVVSADARLGFQHTLVESKRLAPARSSHGVTQKPMKRRILILARRFSTQDTTILRHHHTSVTFSAAPPWILTPDTAI